MNGLISSCGVKETQTGGPAFRQTDSSMRSYRWLLTAYNQLLLKPLIILSLHLLGSGVYFGKLDFGPPESCDNITAETRLLQYPFRTNQFT